MRYRSVILEHLVPFLLWYGLMFLFALGFDYLLHYFKLVYIGRYLGYAGTLTIGASFVYSLRKRKIIEKGSPKTFLELHEYMAWAGSILLLIHAGVHFNALLPWLAIVMLLIVVALGLIGKFLLKRSGEQIMANKKNLAAEGLTPEEINKKLFLDSIAFDLMKQWRKVHLPAALILAILAFLHILSVFLFSK